MPLPDERPRQSVANLIGRFEQQNKRQSSIGASPRSSSVASHTTGDSAIEEVREKREWPPKSPVPNDKPPIIPSSPWTRPTPPTSQPKHPPTNPTERVSPPAPVNESITTSTSTSVVLSPPAAKVVSQPQRQPSISGSTNPKPLVTPTPLTSPAKIPVVNPPAPPSPQTPSKSSVKSTPKQYFGTSSQPLKPQHTGQSTISTSTGRKPSSRTVPTTPGLPKTPSHASTNPKTPSRAKTPSSSRPKTPSGLFAPTAASLARARNAQPQLPTPTKKVTLSSSAADRLSKPTAASMSKARSPAPVPASPAKGGAKTPAMRVGATGGTANAKVPPASVRGKQEKEKQKAPGTPQVGAKEAVAAVSGVGASAIAAATVLETEEIPDEDVLSQHENGYGLDESMHEEEASHIEYEEELQQEPEVADELEVQEPDIEIEDEEVRQGADRSVDAADAETASLASFGDSDPLPETGDQEADANPHAMHETEPEFEFDHESRASDTSVTISGPEPEHRMDEVKTRVHMGNDIEEMVNLLESVPVAKARPLSVASIPDEVHEIPDED